MAIVQGLIENICPTSRFTQGFGNQHDPNDDLPAEYQEEGTNFERASFQPLFSVPIYRADNLPNIENYTLHVLQCIQAVNASQNEEFLGEVGKQLTKDTQTYFGELLQENNIRL